MSQGNYDHPTYLTRQQLALGRTTAGAAGTSLQKAFTNDMRIRNVSALVITAGTATTHNLTVRNGTTSVGLITLSTSTALTVTTSGDLNYLLPKGSVLNVLNGADATGVADVTVEAHTDAQSNWVGL